MSVVDLTDEVNDKDTGNNADKNNDIQIGIIANIPKELMTGVMNPPENNGSRTILKNLNKADHTPTLFRDAIIEIGVAPKCASCRYGRNWKNQDCRGTGTQD